MFLPLRISQKTTRPSFSLYSNYYYYYCSSVCTLLLEYWNHWECLFSLFYLSLCRKFHFFCGSFCSLDLRFGGKLVRLVFFSTVMRVWFVLGQLVSCCILCGLFAMISKVYLFGVLKKKGSFFFWLVSFFSLLDVVYALGFLSENFGSCFWLMFRLFSLPLLWDGFQYFFCYNWKLH